MVTTQRISLRVSALLKSKTFTNGHIGRKMFLLPLLLLLWFSAFARPEISTKNALQASDAMLVDTTTLEASICAGDTYPFGGILLNTPGIYTQDLIAEDGSDSTVVLLLTVLPLSFSEIFAKICAGEPYIFNGQTITESGDYTEVLTGSNGCDSINTLHISVLPVTMTMLQAGICTGASYLFEGEALTESGIYTNVLIGENGCDSFVVLNLAVVSFFETPLQVGICAGDFYVFAGDTLTLGGVYTDTLTASGGCDSVLILTLSILPNKTTNLAVGVCEGFSYNFNGLTLTESGTYTDSLQTVAGCDSIVVLNLTVAVFFETAITAGICANETYDFGGQSLNQSGEYTTTVPAAGGCDSILNLTLTVFPLQPETMLEASICATEVYLFNGELLDQSGTYTAILSDVNGCDSTVVLTLTVLPVAETNLEATTCSNEPYEFNGDALSDAGVYVYSFTAENGCDSTVTLTLQVLPVAETSLSAEICDGATLEFNGQILDEAGTYTAILTAENGCDSIVTLTLGVLPVQITDLQETICSNELYNFNGQTLSDPGTYTATLTAENGCDSIVTLVLDVLPTQSSNIDATICSNETYEFNGDTLNTQGTYEAMLSGENGCDSIVTLNLNVLPAPVTETSATICANEIYDFYGAPLQIAGTYNAVFTAENGCDSTVVLTLSVLPLAQTGLIVQICVGTSFPFNGLDLTESGDYTFTLASENGCDSTVTLQLLVSDPLTSSITTSICSGEVYEYAGQAYTESGNYPVTLTAIGGCDSIVTLSLTVLPNVTTDLAEAICQGGFYIFNGAALTDAGTYTAGYTAANGCDSIVTLVLTVFATSETAIAATICAGASYDFNGDALTESGDYTAVLSNELGCDSIVTLTLAVLPEVPETNLTADICAGASYDFNGETLTQSGNFTATLSNVNSCDSVVMLTLTVLPVLESDINATICEGETYAYNGVALTDSGVYPFGFTGSNGCDSTVTVTLTVLPKAAIGLDVHICEGETYTFNGQNLGLAGTYQAVYAGSNGCDSTVTLVLTVFPVTASGQVQTICDGESYTFFGQALSEAGTYTAVLQNSNGCDSTIILNLLVTVVETGVSLQSGTLEAAAVNASYQWYDCDTNQPITGATGNTYTPTVTGNYFVAINQSGCADTSICVFVMVVSTKEEQKGLYDWTLHPNPAGMYTFVTVTGAPSENFDLEIVDLTGRLLHRQSLQFTGSPVRVDLTDFPAGVLVVKLTDGRHVAAKRLVRMSR